MSPRVIIFSVILTVLFAGGALFWLVGDGVGLRPGDGDAEVGDVESGDGGEFDDHGDAGNVDSTARNGSRSSAGRDSGGRGSGAADRGTGRGGSSSRDGDGRAAGSGPDGSLAEGGGRGGDGDPTLTSGDRERGGDRDSARDRGDRGGRDGEEFGADAISITGKLVGIDPIGQEFPRESGTVQMRATGGGADLTREVTVTQGAFTARAPAGTRIRFESALLDDRTGTIQPMRTYTVAEGLTVELVARLSTRTLLHVRSRETGEELADLELLRISSWLRHSRAHPGVVAPQDSRWTTEASPIALDAEGTQVGNSIPYHVRATGYAWGRILLDTAAGGDREILLDPGGDLDLTLTGGWDRPGAILRLRTLGESQPYAEVEVQGQRMLVGGVLPGHYEVSVETGSWNQDPLILGSAEVTVAAGSVASLELDVADLDDEERVSLSGTVFVPAGWELEDFTLRIRPLDPGANVAEETQDIPSIEMSAQELAGGILYGWAADAVKPGNYSLQVLPVGYGVSVSVGDLGLEDAVVELPAAVVVEVLTLMAGTGLPADPSIIRWTPALPSGIPGAGASAVSPQPGTTHVFPFSAPLGEIIISCSDVAYRPTSRRVTLTSGETNSFTLELQPAHGLSVALYDEATPVPWDIGWHAQLIALPGTNGQVVSRGRIGDGYRILVSNPGNYTLTLPEIPGFLPVPPLEVEVIPEMISDVNISLEREP